jgi:hypothetical protein
MTSSRMAAYPLVNDVCDIAQTDFPTPFNFVIADDVFVDVLDVFFPLTTWRSWRSYCLREGPTDEGRNE